MVRSLRSFLFMAILITSRVYSGWASHIVGGEIFYECLGNDQYLITMKVYRDCFNGVPPLDNPAYIGVFNGSNVLVQNPAVYLDADSVIPNISNNPCLIFPPNICVEEGTYQFTLTLPPTPGGYTIAYQRCCRNYTIANIFDPTNSGTTIFTEIPDAALAPCNSSPYYLNYPPTLICANYPLIFDHAAMDPDGDSLVYSICTPFHGASSLNPQPFTPSNPPFPYVTYQAPYTALDPLGTVPPMAIDPVTGLLTVTPDAIGQYVVGICVSEYRNGQLLEVHMRDFQFNVSECTAPAIAALPSILNGCDAFYFEFPNYSTGASSYLWDFGVPGVTNDTSSLFSPSFTFPDTGIYTVTLYANPGSFCGDTATMLVYVYPKFAGGITAPDGCTFQTLQFVDSTTSTFGSINSWFWSFANLGSSTIQNPTFSFDTTGTFLVSLIVTNTLGCVDTVTTFLTIHPTPEAFAYPDTTICFLDTIQLTGTGIGTYDWTPSYGLSTPFVANPLASPDVETTYVLRVENQWGCWDTASIVISVIKEIVADAFPDTVLCPGEIVQLDSYGGWVFVWSPPGGLSNPSIHNPTATPSVSTTYMLTTSIGSCKDSAAVYVGVKPLPFIVAGPDHTICVGDTVQLESCCGTQFKWSPPDFLSSGVVPNPLAFPEETTSYALEATDTNSCPLVVLDTVHVFVLDPPPLTSTPDTLIYLGTSADLYSYGAAYYSWSPPDYLSDDEISNPVSTPDQTITYRIDATTEDGCKLYDTVTVTVVEDPFVIVPNAFTPNNDGLNDFFYPIVLGLFDAKIFMVFNRWGQVVYESNDISVGWDGKHRGVHSEMGTYVYLLEGASSTTGKQYFLKGNVVLLR